MFLRAILSSALLRNPNKHANENKIKMRTKNKTEKIRTIAIQISFVISKIRYKKYSIVETKEIRYNKIEKLFS